MVKPDHWQQVSQLYHAALAKDPNERGPCGGKWNPCSHTKAPRRGSSQPRRWSSAKVMAEDSGGSLSGRKIGSYQILSRLGAGGMGEVYRARDAKLNRDIALKVLPEHFAHNADRLARFRREAQILASLNHPNIAAIYGLEESTLDGGARGASWAPDGTAAAVTHSM
jgi:hypothetical protein